MLDLLNLVYRFLKGYQLIFIYHSLLEPCITSIFKNLFYFFLYFSFTEHLSLYHTQLVHFSAFVWYSASVICIHMLVYVCVCAVRTCSAHTYLRNYPRVWLYGYTRVLHAVCLCLSASSSSSTSVCFPLEWFVFFFIHFFSWLFSYLFC